MEGKLAACCGPTMSVWDPQRSSADNLVVSRDEPAHLNIVSWVGNGRALASGGDDGIVKFYTSDDIRQVATIPKTSDTTTPRHEITGLAHMSGSVVYATRQGEVYVAQVSTLQVCVPSF